MTGPSLPESPAHTLLQTSPLLMKGESRRDMEEGLSAAPSASPALSRLLVRKPSSSFEDLPCVLSLVTDDEDIGPSHNSDTTQVTSRAILAYDKVQYFGNQLLLDGKWHLLVAILAWYVVGLFAIVTTKLLMMEWHVPPLLLTFQQFLVASTLLKIRLYFSREGIAPWPWWNKAHSSKLLHFSSSPPTTGAMVAISDEVPHEAMTAYNTGSMDFLMTGLFNSLDLLASNAAFAASAASFVETIKSCDPISTTAVALIWQVDRLESDEGVCLFVLVAGMMLSTWGNSTGEDSSMSLVDSTQAAATVMTANVCFAFRAMSQKLYRRHAVDQMNDENLLAKMFQIGWLALFLPCAMYHADHIHAALEAPMAWQVQYAKLAGLNAVAFATYNLASTYVLSKLSVLHHSTLGCLRRMFVVVGTCIFFGVPLTGIGALGLITSFGGFCGFTFYRNLRKRREEKSDV